MIFVPHHLVSYAGEEPRKKDRGFMRKMNYALLLMVQTTVFFNTMAFARDVGGVDACINIKGLGEAIRTIRAESGFDTAAATNEHILWLRYYAAVKRDEAFKDAYRKFEAACIQGNDARLPEDQYKPIVCQSDYKSKEMAVYPCEGVGGIHQACVGTLVSNIPEEPVDSKVINYVENDRYYPRIQFNDDPLKRNLKVFDMDWSGKIERWKCVNSKGLINETIAESFSSTATIRYLIDFIRNGGNIIGK